MAKKKKPRHKKQKSYVPYLSASRYDPLFLILERGENEAQIHGRTVMFFSIEGGERPARLLADFQYVAKDAKIPVTIKNYDGDNLKFTYAVPGPDEIRVEVYDEKQLIDVKTFGAE